MTTGAGSGALTALKNKMQALREELDKSQEQLETKTRELDAEKANRTQVSWPRPSN